MPQFSLRSLANLIQASQSNNKTIGHQIYFPSKEIQIKTLAINRREGKLSVTRFKSQKRKGQKMPTNHLDIKCQKENKSQKITLDILSFLKITAMFLKNHRNVFLSIYFPLSYNTQSYNSLCEREVSFCTLANPVAIFIQVNLVHCVGC